MPKSKTLFLVLSFLFTSLPSSLQASFDPAEVLLSTFRSQCPNVVSFSGSATLLLNGYKNALLELKNNEACSGVGAGLSSFANFEKAFTTYELYRTAKLDKAAKEKMVAQYTLYLAQNQMSLSSDETAYMEEQIYINQGEIIALNSEISRFESMGQGFEQGANSFLMSFNDLIGAIGSSNQCLNKTSGLYGSVLGNALSIAGLYQTPATALTMSLAGAVTKSVSSFIRDAEYLKSFEEMDSVLWPEAFRCVSEAMTKNYCESLQTQNLFEEYLNQEKENYSIFEGVDLLNHGIKGLDEWLVQVFAGSPITSQGDLTDREKPILQAELLGRIVRYMQGYKTIKDTDLDSISDPSLVSNAVYGAFVGLSYIMRNPATLNPSTVENQCWENCNSAVQNPIFTARTQTLLLFQMLGLNEIPAECRIDGEVTVCSSLKLYLDQKGIKLNLSDWMRAYNNAQQVVADSLKQVNEVRAKTVSFDPVGLFVLANRKFSNRTNATGGLLKILKAAQNAYNYIQNVACEEEAEYCEDGVPTWENSYSLQLEDINETIKLTKTVLELVREAANPRDIADFEGLPDRCQKTPDLDIFFTIDSKRKEKAFILSSCITDILELAERGNDIYFSKVRRFVSMELEARLLKGELSTSMSDILKATRDDLVDRLTSSITMSSQVSIGQIQTGLDSNMDITLKTMDLFQDKFTKYIVKAVNDPNNSPRVTAEMCFRALAYVGRNQPVKDEQRGDSRFLSDIWDTCYNASLNEFSNGPVLKWKEFVTKSKKGLKIEYKPTKERMDLVCVLDNFFIENKLIRERKKNTK